MRLSERFGYACSSLLLLASCATVSGPAEPASTSMPEPAAMARAQPDCAALFVPVTDRPQDKNEPECAAPGDAGLEGYPKGHACRLPVEFVHPTQPAVGVTAVNCKRDSLVGKSESKLDKYLRKGSRVVPTVIGPDGNYYITDHHHLATALYKTLEEKPAERQTIRLYAEIVGNFFTAGSESPGEGEMRRFWQTMSGCNNAYLDYLGQPVDPLDPEQMPAHLSQAKDDPYRTLSRWVRDADGYIKPDVQPANFLEFTWAAKFRRDLDQPVTRCRIDKSVESEDCQEQIRQLRQSLERAMASARAYDSVEWIEDGNCASDLAGDPKALISCGYNPAMMIAEVDKYITPDRGCETADQYSWQNTAEGVPPADTLAWFRYARGHATEAYGVCRAAAGELLYAGVIDSDAGSCSFVDADDNLQASAAYEALTGVQGMYAWTGYAEDDAGDDEDFFDDAIPVDTKATDLGQTYLCASGSRIGWVKKGKKTCHLSEKGLHVPFSVLVAD